MTPKYFTGLQRRQFSPQILRAEAVEVLRSRLYELQSEHLIAESQEDDADRMLGRAIREVVNIERFLVSGGRSSYFCVLTIHTERSDD